MNEETRPSRFTSLARLAILFAIVGAVGFSIGLYVANPTKHFINDLPLLGNGLDSTPDPSADLGEFWKAWNVMNVRFVDAHASSTIPEGKEKIWGAIEGLIESYGDPYTVFMRPEAAKQFAEDISGNFGGVGMEIGMKDDVLTVIAPLKNTPAERAGIQTGDQILTIDGRSTDGMSTDEAVKLIRGPKGTTVTLKIVRKGEVLDVSIVRDLIEVPTIETAYRADSGVFVISFYSFTANSGSLFTKALAEYRESGSHRLIVDLRGNPGGYLAAAVSVASHFIPTGQVVVTEDYDGHKENIVHESKGTAGLPEGTKTVVLINQGSASASEIVAGALQDSHGATLIGMHSFGKGSVQELVSLAGGSLKITVARWLTPSGRSISDGGLKPDIEVDRTQEDVAAGRDPQMERAIRFLTTGE
jgi:carboxyl-terminal processing protease